MRKLYDEFFYIPQHGKVRDKVMLARVALTTVIMIVCLIAMSVSAYACFSCSITSANNRINSADFTISVSINDGAVDVIKQNGQTYTAALEADEPYTVTLSRVGTAQTGFCVISAANAEGEAYHTRQLGVDAKAADGGSDTFSFSLRVTEDTIVSFAAHWGTSSHYDDYVNTGDDDERYITDADGEIVMRVIAVTPSTEGDSTTTNDQSAVTTSSTDRTDTGITDGQTTAATTQQTTTTNTVSSTDMSETEASSTTLIPSTTASVTAASTDSTDT